MKWVLRYLRGTARIGLAFQGLKTEKPRVLQSYIDTDYMGDLDQLEGEIARHDGSFNNRDEIHSYN